MSTIRLEVDRLVVETDAERRRVEQLPAKLEEAFQQLADRLAKSPLGREVRLGERVLERLRIDTLAADELLGPRGAERLAEELYRQLTEQFSTEVFR